MPNPLSPTLTQKLRDTVVQYGQPDRYTQLRDVEVDDGAGGQVVTTAAIASGWCRLTDPFAMTQARLQVASGLVTQTVPYQIALPWGSDVRAQDQFVVAGRTFRAVASAQAEADGFETYAICTEVT
jgi:hypothetical protein